MENKWSCSSEDPGNTDRKRAQKIGASRALMRTTNCPRDELPEFFLSHRTVLLPRKEREDFNFSFFYIRRPFDTLSKRVRQPARMATFVASFRDNPQRHSAKITSRAKPSHDSYVGRFLRTFKGLHQTLKGRFRSPISAVKRYSKTLKNFLLQLSHPTDSK